jgi:hypothetical protein
MILWYLSLRANMEQIIKIAIQLITMKVSWGLPDEVKIYLWLWLMGLFIIIGLVSSAIRFAFKKIKEFTE